MTARALATNAVWALASHVLHRGSLMLGAILLARSLPTGDFAAYSYFQMTVSMLSTYAAMGLGVTASRFFAEYGHQRDGAAAPLGTLLALSFGLAALAFFAILLLPGVWLDAGVSVPQWLIALGVAAAVAGVVPEGGILGLEKYRQASLVSLLSAVCMLGMTGVAAMRQSPLLGMWGIVASLAVQNLGQLIVIVRTVGWQAIAGSFGWSAQILRKLASFAGPMFLVSILAGSGTWIVGRMILASTGALEFSAYSIGLQWFALGSLLPCMVARVMLPRLVRNRGRDSRRIMKLSVLISIAPAFVLAVVGFLISPWLIAIYGQSYRDYSQIIPAFLVISTFSAPINSIGNGILANDGQLQWLGVTAASLSILILSFATFPTQSSWFAAASHMLSTTTMLAMAVRLGRIGSLI